MEEKKKKLWSYPIQHEHSTHDFYEKQNKAGCSVLVLPSSCLMAPRGFDFIFLQGYIGITSLYSAVALLTLVLRFHFRRGPRGGSLSLILVETNKQLDTAFIHYVGLPVHQGG